MNFLPIVEGRSCGTCTKCCDGQLGADIELTDGRKGWMGYKENVGIVPCPFVITGKGCSEYEKRPVNPCHVFKCDWLTNPDMPESFRPERSQALFSTRRIEGILYTMLVELGHKLDSEVLSWAITYHLEKGTNFSWKVLDNVFWIGSEEFNKIMDKEYPLIKNG